MLNFSILISNSEVTGPGGLFDINATLPLVAIQFLLLMVFLNTVLYSPLLEVIAERNEYILNNLAKASEILAQANELTAQYEQELNSVRKEAQLEITNSQKIHKEILEIELNISQKYIDNLSSISVHNDCVTVSKLLSAVFFLSKRSFVIVSNKLSIYF